MATIYTIKPSSQRASFRAAFQHVFNINEIPEHILDATIDKIEIHITAQTWHIHFAHTSLSTEHCQQLEHMLVSQLQHVKRVQFSSTTPETKAPSHSEEPAPTVKREEPSRRNYREPKKQDEQHDVPMVEMATTADESNTTTDDEEDYMNLIMEMARRQEFEPDPPAISKTKSKRGTKQKNIVGSAIREDAIPLSEITDEERKVVVEGEIFSMDVRALRSGRTLVTFDFTDGTDSLSAKLFFDEDEKNRAGALQEGLHIRARGPVQYDRFTQELTLMPRDVNVLPPKEEVMDEHDEPRVELHLHTKMSALDGITEVEDAIALAAKWEHPAIAITDHGVVQAFPRAYAAGQKHGIKILFGVEGYLIESADQTTRPYHIVFLAKNEEGLQNLYRLISKAHIDYFYRNPRTPRDVLIEHRAGLIVGSACEAGEVYQAVLQGKPDEEVEEIATFYDYLEIQPLANTQFHVEAGRVPDREALKDINRRIVRIGRKLGKPVVATGDVHFLKPEHEVFRQIVMAGHGFTDIEQPTPLYLRTTQEMLEEFSYLGEEEARRVVIEDPRAIADSIEELRPIPDGFHPPHLDGAEEEIRRMTVERAHKLYGEPLPELIAARIKKELDSIIGNGYASLYLIAHKLVKKSLEDGYLVGSRGSVGSSFVANMCDISEVNPLPPHYVCHQCHHWEVFDDGSVGAGPDLPVKNCPRCDIPLHRDGFDIPFETFLGFEGDKVPDIDLNFSGEYQPRAHQFAETMFGKDNLYRAGTISTLGERTAYGYVRNFLEDQNRQVRTAEINRLVKGITGIRRTSGQHPGGLMVVPKGRDIHEFTPIQYPANDRKSDTITTHFDFNTIHDQLVKLDLLGHEGPTVVKMLEDGTEVKATDIPLDDPDTMAIFSSLKSLGISEEDAMGKVGTLGIPEYGTSFVRQMLEDTKPKTFADLVRIMGLSHGTDVWLNNAQDLVRNGTVTLSETIAARDDIMIYLIRKGLEPHLAFKIMEQVRRGRGLESEDERIMKEHGVPDWYREACKKISYMFPKAHAVAYAVMAFYIAYFKVHHKEHFYATYFTMKSDDCDADLLVQGEDALRQTWQAIQKKGNDASAKEKSVMTVVEVAIEAIARGIRFLPIDLYRSDARRVLVANEGLLLPLASMPGIGVSAAENIVVARQDGEFTSIEDIRRRSGVSKTVTEALTEHGCLSDLPETDQLSLF